MAVDTRKYSEKIRKLCAEYYNRNIQHDEYMHQRNMVLNDLEREIYGETVTQEVQKDNFIGIVRSCFKKLSTTE